MLTHVRNQKGAALVDWLYQIQQNISVLKPRMEYFVLALLRIGWADQDETVVAAYRDFLANLVTAQGYYTKPVIKMLVSNLMGVANRAAVAQENQGAVDIVALEKAVFDNTHETLKVILGFTPLAGREATKKYTKECMPYVLSPDTQAHTNYLANLLRMCGYFTGEKVYLLTLVVDRLVQLDAHIDKELLEEEEDSDGDQTKKSPHVVAKANLDSGMKALVGHIDKQEDLKSFYFDLIKVFESFVLPAHTGHVQFAAFYVMGKKPALATHFLEFLWSKFQSPNTPSVIRQVCMSYIASLTSRAMYVSVSMLMASLEKMTSWIHAYIASASTTTGCVAMSGTALASHGPFYAACQAVFYMFAFRHEELTRSKKHLAFLRSLHFNTIVTSRLNPLFYCMFHVVRNFAAIARNYQLAYCETIIQRNNRICLPVVGSAQAALSARREDAASKNNVLDAFFPFDPYRLPLSKGHFQGFYREYSAADDSSSSEEESEAESEAAEDEAPSNAIEDFLMEIEDMENKPPKSKRRRTESTLSNGSIDFAYGASPGFKH